MAHTPVREHDWIAEQDGNSPEWYVTMYNGDAAIRTIAAGLTREQAHTVAAAPDMLKALKEAVHWWHNKPGTLYAKQPAWLETAYAVINRAGGES